MSLHKWLYAPKGTGLLYARRDKIGKIWPLMAAEKKQASDIRKFEEIGTHSAAPRLAIGEALLFHEGIGAARKEARLRFLSRYWMNQVKSYRTFASTRRSTTAPARSRRWRSRGSSRAP